MMHFFRKPRLHLDCFTKRIDVVEYAPIDHAIKYIPEWWKLLPKEMYVAPDNPVSPTMKTCYGMYEFYSKSICLPLWSELSVTTNQGAYSWQFSDRTTSGLVHNPKQYEGFAFTGGHLKIESPWFLSTKKDTPWVSSHPSYSNNHTFDYVVLPGVMEFKHQNATNIQMLISLRENKTFRIAHRTPMVLFTPMSDKSVTLHRHLITESEYEKISQKHTSITFINKYKKQQKIIRCPYKDETK